jgi:hypothetical protein
MSASSEYETPRQLLERVELSRSTALQVCKRLLRAYGDAK